MVVYISTKFHENILNGIRNTERIRNVNGRTDGRADGRTDGGHDIMRPIFDGRIKKAHLLVFRLSYVLLHVMSLFLSFLISCLKVGSCSFEYIIMLLILFSKLSESTFYKEISKFQ